MPTLRIKDGPGKMPVAKMRELFEAAISGTPLLRSSTPLGTMEVNGEFSHYMNPETDTLWIGFALGLRMGERIVQTAETNHAQASQI